jgi:hypothetical protein
LSSSSQKYGFGIRDPEKTRIPDPGVKKAPDPGSATLEIQRFIGPQNSLEVLFKNSSGYKILRLPHILYQCKKLRVTEYPIGVVLTTEQI